MYVANNEVKTVASMILRKLYDRSVGNQIISQRLDLLFEELNNDSTHYIQNSVFDSGLGYAVDRRWIEYSQTANEVRITPDGCNEVLNKTHIEGILFGFLLLFAIGNLVYAVTDYKESALSWQKQALDTRKTVVGVMDELNKIGDKGNPDAKGLIADAQNWLQEADKNTSQADKEMKENKFEKASYGYNMAWQYYVKSATVALNARRILTGQ